MVLSREFDVRGRGGDGRDRGGCMVFSITPPLRSSRGYTSKHLTLWVMHNARFGGARVYRTNFTTASAVL